MNKKEELLRWLKTTSNFQAIGMPVSMHELIKEALAEEFKAGCSESATALNPEIEKLQRELKSRADAIKERDAARAELAAEKRRADRLAAGEEIESDYLVASDHKILGLIAERDEALSKLRQLREYVETRGQYWAWRTDLLAILNPPRETVHQYCEKHEDCACLDSIANIESTSPTKVAYDLVEREVVLVKDQYSSSAQVVDYPSHFAEMRKHLWLGGIAKVTFKVPRKSLAERLEAAVESGSTEEFAEAIKAVRELESKVK